MVSFFARIPGFSWVVLPAAGLLLSAVPAVPQAPITTEQLVSRLSASIANLKTLRCNVKAQERIGTKFIDAYSLMKLTEKPLRIYIKDKKGVEVLWVTGQNDGDAWVYPAAFPYVTLNLDPKGSLMRRNQHHTALQAGFGTIAELLSSTRADNTFTRSFRYTNDTTLQGRSCYVLRADYPQFKYLAYKVSKGETINSIANKYGCGPYRITERNNLSVDETLSEGKVIQVPNAYGRKVILCVDPKTYLPVLVQVNDDKGLFEKFEFMDVVANQPIPLEEFTKTYKGYKF